MTRRRIAWVGALLGLALAAPGCEGRRAVGPIGISVREGRTFEYRWKEYQKLAPHRAIAGAGEPGDFGVTGFSGGRSDPERAKAAALRRCEERRVDRRVKAECVLYAVDDEIVYDGPRR